MTLTTMLAHDSSGPDTPRATGQARAALGTMRETMRAEWTKLRTLPGMIWLLTATAVLTIAASAAAAATTTCTAGSACQVDTAKLSLTGVQFGQAAVAVLGVLAVGDEYSTGMIRTTLAAIPHRTRMLAAKAAVLTAPVLATASLAAGGSLLAGRIMLPGNGFTAARGFPTLSLEDGPVLRATAGSALYLALVALLALGVAVIVRDTATATGIVLGLLYIFPIIGVVVSNNPALQRHLEQIGPMTAGLEIQATTGLRDLPLSPWEGLAVLAAWATAALLAGALLLRFRDA